MNWDFLEEVLNAVGLKAHLIKLIMFTVTSTTLSVVWNAEIQEPFKPGRRFRRGDPLAPYLFLRFMEAGGHCIQQLAQEGSWKGI